MRQREVKVAAVISCFLVVFILATTYYQLMPSAVIQSATTEGASGAHVSSSSFSSLPRGSTLESSSSSLRSAFSSSPISSSSVSSYLAPGQKGYLLDVVIPRGASNQVALGYLPHDVRVFLAINNSARWTNNDTVPHTVTFTNWPPGSLAIDSGELAPGATFTYTFTVVGTYRYHCSYHPWMNGTIVQVGELNPYA